MCAGLVVNFTLRTQCLSAVWGMMGGVIQCEDMHLEMVNCYFSLTADADFIYHHCEDGSFTATNTTFDASGIQSNDLVSIMDLHSATKIFKNTQIMCPKSLGVSASIDLQS